MNMINLEKKEGYVKAIKVKTGKILLEVGDDWDDYTVFLTQEEAKKVIEMLKGELKES